MINFISDRGYERSDISAAYNRMVEILRLAKDDRPDKKERNAKHYNEEK